jgi:hypothetical protein
VLRRPIETHPTYWDAELTSKEAAALGLTSPVIKQFAIDYVQTHKRRFAPGQQ